MLIRRWLLIMTYALLLNFTISGMKPAHSYLLPSEQILEFVARQTAKTYNFRLNVLAESPDPVRPEALLINPDPGISGLNRLTVKVKTTLFDGANSRLLAGPPDSDRELKIALPQNRQFDHIRPSDTIEIGWDRDSGICFPGGKNHP